MSYNTLPETNIAVDPLPLKLGLNPPEGNESIFQPIHFWGANSDSGRGFSLGINHRHILR